VARFNITSDTISNQIGNVIQFTGSTTGQDTYHRLASVSDTNVISIAKTSGDPTITTDYFAYVTAPSTAFTGVGNTITATAHGLVVGNKFRALDASNNNVGDYIVDTVVDINTITVSGGIGAADGFILKHGLSSNEGISDKSNENLQVRGITIFDNETLTLTETGGIIASDTTFAVSNSGIGTIQRFPLGSYLQVDNEIMRVASDSLSGINVDKITVIRGALATKATAHNENSLIKKIKIPSVEFRRPSIIRASGHTFEYLGYGPGNYSTGLPQVQVKSLPEREEFLVQAQERSAGIVVYTGMNNRGDFYIGNQKKSAATGEETTFDTPIPTITGEDPSRLSAVFDEIIVKERIVVEGGDSGQVLSQFDGPVTFNGKTRFTEVVKVSNETNSTSSTSGALVVTGGVGIGKSLYVGGDANIGGDTNIGGELILGGDLTITGGISVSGIVTANEFHLDDNEKATFGNDNDLEIYHNGTNSYIDNNTGHIYIRNNVDNDDNSNIYIQAKSGENGIVVNDDGEVVLYYDNSQKLQTTSGGVDIDGDLTVSGDITAFYTSDQRLKDNVTRIEDPLAKVLSISGNTFDWNENSNKEGHDVGLIAQEILSVLPEAVTTRDNGYLAVDYYKVIPLLVEAIKGLSDKVEALEQKLQDK
jgi:cytoskeletal protein CcmA (bactofilin family)